MSGDDRGASAMVEKKQRMEKKREYMENHISYLALVNV